MGLDMYLSVKNYISRWDYSKGYDKRFEKPEFVAAKESLGHRARYLSPDAVGIEQTFTVAYWRKANAIHNWFVQNVQNGEDNCAEYYVSLDNLRELRDMCQMVIKSDFNLGFIKEYLPPTSGFLFGSTEVDDWYKDDIILTNDRLTDIIAMADEDAKEQVYVTFTYQSSW